MKLQKLEMIIFKVFKRFQRMYNKVHNLIIRIDRKLRPIAWEESWYIKPERIGDPLRSQKGQVRFLLEVAFNYQKNGLKRNGYFVDLAAADPINASNTYFIEKYLGWNGLLIEPNPKFASLLRKVRTSKVVEKVVGNKDNQNVKFRVDTMTLGKVLNNQLPKKTLFEKPKIINLKTITLEKILDDNSAPEVMDYLSLDVEGYEWEVIKDFNFDKYKWKVMNIENSNLEIDLLLDKHGYIQIMHRNFDTFYIHKDFISFANLKNHVPRFLLNPYYF